MTPRLKSLTIENFRSIRGNVVVPLDARVVLVHGSNGMGKTSVLSALELSLTGSIAHLDRSQSLYRQYLTNFDAESGSIQLSVEELPSGVGRSPGSLTFSPSSFDPSPVLPEHLAVFFSQRCYLPQAALGRLLEMYDEQKKGAQSELTQFVKELLRIDPLDALVDGLYHAFNVSRIRKISPSFKQLEELLANYEDQSKTLATTVTTMSQALETRRTRLFEMLASLFPNQTYTAADLDLKLGELRARVADRSVDEGELSQLAAYKSELSTLLSEFTEAGDNSADVDIANAQRVEAESGKLLQDWSSGPGARILNILEALRAYYGDLAEPNLDFSTVVKDATAWSASEIARCDRLLTQHDKAVTALNAARGVVARSAARIGEINQALEAGANDARTLANALAGIAPHVEGDVCPVCSRDYGELDRGPLTAHIAATIASLTSEAGRLQALATERADESERLNAAQRDVVSAERGVLSSNELIRWRQTRAALASILAQLVELQLEADKGSELGRQLTEARSTLSKTRRALRLSVSLLPQIEVAVERTTARSLSTFTSPPAALSEALAAITARLSAVEKRLALRISIASELDQYERESLQLADRRAEGARLANRIGAVEKTFSDISDVRDRAKIVSNAASSVRSNIVRDVFSGSLNTVWRDLFVRLAPGEEFVPKFKLPIDESGKVEAILETVHRSGKAAGTPGAMLSQGNLNTAALTLFLALHLSVEAHLPWLVLDDPVQSMDDVHIAQFAALLRTLSKGLGKQVVVAVHERALFDYLSLELSPAFAGDSLITIEISRSFDGRTVADPKFFEFVDDNAVAA